MKLVIKEDNIETINSLFSTATITYGYTSWDGKRSIDYRGHASNLHFNKELKKWVVEYRNKEINFRELLSELTKGTRYATQSKTLKDLAKMYVKCNDADDKEKFDRYLDNLGQKTFNIKDVKIYTDEIDWLREHVTNITARFPNKYRKDFEKNFPGSEYTLYDKGWNYAFTMYFDTMEGIPQSLLTMSNSLGNTLDYDKKRMCNTSYIWKLIKNYEGFDFGKRNI